MPAVCAATNFSATATATVAAFAAASDDRILALDTAVATIAFAASILAAEVRCSYNHIEEVRNPADLEPGRRPGLAPARPDLAHRAAAQPEGFCDFRIAARARRLPLRYVRSPITDGARRVGPVHARKRPRNEPRAAKAGCGRLAACRHAFG